MNIFFYAPLYITVTMLILDPTNIENWYGLNDVIWYYL